MHPLDPCTEDELTAAVALVQSTGNLGERTFYSCAYPVEPSKDVMRGHQSGAAFDRLVRVIGHDRDQGQTFECDVSLSSDDVRSFRWEEHGQAPVSLADVVAVYEILNEHDGWLAALKERGIDDPSLLHLEPWLTGVHPPELPSGRVHRVIAFLHAHPDDNHYARPIQGLMALVDSDSGTVVIEDHGVMPIPPEAGDYAAALVGELRDDLKPLEITQPDGPSFQADGQVITWQRWHMRVSINPIEGLVLHDVRYRDGDRDRPILYRASLSEMVVPYGDPNPLHYWKHAFDAGETALGHSANSLKLGCDCLGEIYYFDASFLGSDGEPNTVENAICLHEEDFGILWKHTNSYRPDLPPEVRRSRRLVVSTIHTVGNYEYGFYWYFYLDGTIQMEIKLTGIIGASAITAGDGGDGYAPQVAPSITSPIHQHLFCFRLDFDIDGGGNTVVETNVEPETNRDHPWGAGFRAVATALRTEQEAMRNVDASASRTWKVENPGSLNGLGNPVAYKLLPQASPTMFPPADSPSGRRGGFARHNLWVTPYDPDEHYAGAGPFTNLHPGGVGLSAYTEADRPIENTDVVVWHTLGVTHVPRPEDWPIMPVEYAGFTLVPVGFFDRNPALDVAPSNHCAT